MTDTDHLAEWTAPTGRYQRSADGARRPMRMTLRATDAEWQAMEDAYGAARAVAESLGHDLSRQEYVRQASAKYAFVVGGLIELQGEITQREARIKALEMRLEAME